MTTQIRPEDEQEFVAACRSIIAAEKPPGFLRWELLRGRDGQWLIHSLWRDREAMSALRQAGRTPPILALLDQLGAPHSHDLYVVEVSG